MTAAANRSSRANDETMSLGMGILILECEDGAYQPIGSVETIREAREIAASDMRGRMRSLELGAEPLCPARYLVWARSVSGEYAEVAEIEAN